MSGIYKIINIKNKKVYVGKTVHAFFFRWRIHKNDLRRNTHFNSHLQFSWNKYGEESFQFEIIEECEENKLKEREECWINYYESWKPDRGYNLIRISEGTNCFSEESKKKMSEFRKGKSWEEIMGEEKGTNLRAKFKEKISGENNYFYGKQFVGKENPMYGKYHSEESKKKISESRKGKGSGEKGGLAKLTWKQVREIRGKYNHIEYTYDKLSREYGVAITTIYQIIKNKTWQEEEI